MSGQGSYLRDFCRYALPKNCRVRPTDISALYHHGKPLGKMNTISDFARRSIDFPSWSDLKVPVFCGKDVISSQTTGQQSLLDFVLDSILMRPVDWMVAQQLICAEVASTEKSNPESVDILNFGPGYGVSRSAAKSKGPINIIDVSVDKDPSKSGDAADRYTNDDIAIVGMAVDLPGAPDTQGLWKALADELNAVSEVNLHRIWHFPG